MVSQKRIVGVDYGQARLGVALSDPQLIIASPLMTLKAEKRSEQTVAKLLQELTRHQQENRYELVEIIVGMPLLMSGKSGLFTDEVRHFVQLLERATSIPVIIWDERLSTAQAERSLRESSLTRKRRSKVVDIVAATIILQSYLDFLTDRRTPD